jgi:hypothetical protein
LGCIDERIESLSLDGLRGIATLTEIQDPWIGPFETLEEASIDDKQCCFGVI